MTCLFVEVVENPSPRFNLAFDHSHAELYTRQGSSCMKAFIERRDRHGHPGMDSSHKPLRLMQVECINLLGSGVAREQ
jgi:hypothetical protein